MHSNTQIVKVLKEYWMWFFLGSVLMATMSGMIAYQYLRQDPVTVVMKDARGYVTTKVVHKHPNETVEQVVNKVAPIDSEDFECDYDLNQRINAIDSVKVSEKVNGTIAVDGKVLDFESSAATVGEVLDENNVHISPVDIVTPSRTEPLSNENSAISVTRVTSYTETKTEVLPYTSQTIQSDEAAYNEVTPIQQGRNGIRSYTEEVFYCDGMEIERHITSDQRTEPVNEIIQIGTNLTIGKPNVQPGDIEGWRPYVIKALEENGLEPTEPRINRVLRQIRTESDGDQDVDQQIVDMNTFLGENAQGLMQTIPSTFRDYHHEGYEDIHNGYHNLLAAINYAKERYGPDLVGLGEGHGY